MRRYRIIDHTADLAVYFYGKTPEEVFIHAGAVLFELMINRRPKSGEIRKEVTLAGFDLGDLLVRWLSELLYFFATQNQVMTGAEIKMLSDTRLVAEVELAPVDPTVHEILNEIKAATYHQLEFEPKGEGWRARVTFDV
ncbi:MAG: archease [Deltaproteobacteria bacterium]|nr:archease [Deltaproteobacteria bacterium]